MDGTVFGLDAAQTELHMAGVSFGYIHWFYALVKGLSLKSESTTYRAMNAIEAAGFSLPDLIRRCGVAIASLPHEVKAHLLKQDPTLVDNVDNVDNPENASVKSDTEASVKSDTLTCACAPVRAEKTLSPASKVLKPGIQESKANTKTETGNKGTGASTSTRKRPTLLLMPVLDAHTAKIVDDTATELVQEGIPLTRAAIARVVADVRRKVHVPDLTAWGQAIALAVEQLSRSWHGRSRIEIHNRRQPENFLFGTLENMAHRLLIGAEIKVA